MIEPKCIYMSGKYCDVYTIVDSDDFEMLSKHKWWFNKNRNEISGKPNMKKFVKLWRYLLNVYDPTLQVDHINGNRFDNRKSNLRVVSNKINGRNRHKKRCGTISSYFGVTRDIRETLSKRWIAQIKIDGKHILIGRYLTEENAAEAYNKAAEDAGFLTRNVINAE